MSRKPEFEQDLQTLAQADFSVAAGQSDQDPAMLLREAYARLEEDPSLFSGDPDGVYTYDDPILAVAALWHQKGTKVASNIGTAGKGVSKASIFNWMLTGINAWLNRSQEDYVALAGKTPPAQPLMIDKPRIRIAVVGDAGFNGPAQTRVFRYISERHEEQNFDAVIHLGDTYFGGSEAEMLSNLLAPLSTLREGNVFSLCGNHDLYYGARGYLAALKILHQPGRYFAIETPNWRIGCLDTALGAYDIRRDDGKLDEGQLDWLLRYLVKKDDRPVVLMSHHYILSAWEKPAASLSFQLAEQLKKSGAVFSWYWGHEHGCSTYAREPHGFYGACVGNGAFMEKYKAPAASESLEWHATGPCTCENPKDSPLWPHGYLELELAETEVIETYHLETGEAHERILKTRSTNN